MPIHAVHAQLREMDPETVEVILAACGPGSNSSQTIVELPLLEAYWPESRGAAARSAIATPRTACP